LTGLCVKGAGHRRASSGAARRGIREIGIGEPLLHSLTFRVNRPFTGINVHTRYAQVVVMDGAGKNVKKVRIENANINELAQQYAVAEAVLGVIPNSSYIDDMLNEHLDVTVTYRKNINTIADINKKPDCVDVKELARVFRLNSVAEIYVPTRAVRILLGYQSRSCVSCV